MSEAKAKMSKDKKFYINTVIGLIIIILFWVIPPFGSITKVGMRCLGTFIGMIYLWSTVGALWPSLLGIVLLGLSGIGGEGAAGFKAVYYAAFGNETVLLLIINTLFFGTLDTIGCTQYITHWCLTRKGINGRPYALITAIFIAAYALSTILSPPTAVLVVWPLVYSMVQTLGLEKKDKVWGHIFVGLFCVMCLGQPFFPFKGAQLIIVNAIESVAGVKLNWGSWMLYNLIMTVLITGAYLIVLKFIIKPDVSKLKSVTVEQIDKTMNLPKANMAQKLMLLALPTYVVLILLPNFVKADVAILNILRAIGTFGLSAVFCVVFSIVRFDGKPIMNFKQISAKCFEWGTIFMVAAAVYGAGTLTNEATGVKEFIIDTLNPVLGGRSEYAFVIIMFTLALLLTSVANNAGIGLILIPIAGAFCTQLGIPVVPVCLGTGIMVFASVLTPAACPHAAMMFGKKEIYDGDTIIKIGAPFCLAILLFFIIIGYPLAKLMF